MVKLQIIWVIVITSEIMKIIMVCQNVELAWDTILRGSCHVIRWENIIITCLCLSLLTQLSLFRVEKSNLGWKLCSSQTEHYFIRHLPRPSLCQQCWLSTDSNLTQIIWLTIMTWQNIEIGLKSSIRIDNECLGFSTWFTRHELKLQFSSLLLSDYLVVLSSTQLP